MNNYLEILSVPAIAAIVYWIIEIIKSAVGSSEKFKRLIPLISCLIGVILGIISYYFVPEIIPAKNIFVAIVIGAASGLTATGTNQIVKQLKKGDESGK